MQHPLQCLASIAGERLVAACGPTLLTLDLHGTVVSKWSPAERTNVLDDEAGNGERPAKKQKTSPTPMTPSIIKLVVSPAEQHVVTVTDDKAIHVFEQVDGRLTELSQRVMPKRPCAVQILPDNATILVADKFGDVYSLPLIHVEDEYEKIAADEPKASPKPDAAFKPSASNLTVHSQRNRQALEAQMNQKNFTKRKESLKFPHKLLLGHVSMLTDMKYVAEEKDGKQRGYIITADRDEHIRISRGPPQAHIIEGFCLGHKDFISKICRVGNSNLLVSGGGDSWLGVWEWPSFNLLKKFDLGRLVGEILPDKSKDYQLAVSGIWSATVTRSSETDSALQDDIVIVACEKVNALFLISRAALEADGSLATTIPLSAPPLDVAIVGDSIVVSKDIREVNEFSERLDLIKLSISAPYPEPFDPEPFSGPDATNKELDDLLYGIANLRKRGHLDTNGGEEGDVEE